MFYLLEINIYLKSGRFVASQGQCERDGTSPVPYCIYRAIYIHLAKLLKLVWFVSIDAASLSYFPMESV
jgi:hypothetical protein